MNKPLRTDIEIQEQIHGLVKGLSRKALDATEICVYLPQFKTLYESKQDFRHNYTALFQLISDISEGSEFTASFLADNLELMSVELAQSAHKEEWAGKLEKLCDYLMPEIARIGYINSFTDIVGSQLSKAEQTIKDAQDGVGKLKDDIKGQQKEQHKFSENLLAVQTQVVAVLGLFSVIVVAFVSNSELIGSSLQMMTGQSLLKMILMLIICGFISFNSIVVLMYCIARIIGKDLNSYCDEYACRICTSKTVLGQWIDSFSKDKCTHRDCFHCESRKKCGFIERMKSRMPLVYYFNYVALVTLLVTWLLIAIVALLHYFGFTIIL